MPFLSATVQAQATNNAHWHTAHQQTHATCRSVRIKQRKSVIDDEHGIGVVGAEDVGGVEQPQAQRQQVANSFPTEQSTLSAFTSANDRNGKPTYVRALYANNVPGEAP